MLGFSDPRQCRPQGSLCNFELPWMWKLGTRSSVLFPGTFQMLCTLTAQRMNILPSRIFFQPSVFHVLYPVTNCLSLGWFSTITRQEFGRHFEELVVQSLRKYSFDVAACGGPKDRGIDFRGVWLLKASSVPVIGQCRRYKKRLGPKHVRELSGTLAHEAKGTLGIIVTECGWVSLFCKWMYERWYIWTAEKDMNLWLIIAVVHTT